MPDNLRLALDEHAAHLQRGPEPERFVLLGSFARVRAEAERMARRLNEAEARLAQAEAESEEAW